MVYVWHKAVQESSAAATELLRVTSAGVVADVWSVLGSIVSGGVACVVGVTATAVALRDFWGYDADTDEHAVAEREVRRAAGEAVD